MADHHPALLTGDFDRDGREDVYIPQQGLDAAPFPGAPNILLLQRAPGILSDVSSANVSPNAPAVTHWGATADVDCDVDPDLYDANIGEAGGGPRLMRNDGAGRFTSASMLPSLVASLVQRYTSAAFCDVDRDGWRDVVTNTTDDYTTGRITLYRNRGNGTFEDRTASVPQRLLEWYSKMYAADFNGDGCPDILASQPFEGWGPPGGEALWINQGNLTFTESSLPASVQYGRLFPLDLDEDGRVDSLSLDPGKGSVQLLRNTAP